MPGYTGFCRDYDSRREGHRPRGDDRDGSRHHGDGRDAFRKRSRSADRHRDAINPKNPKHHDSRDRSTRDVFKEAPRAVPGAKLDSLKEMYG